MSAGRISARRDRSNLFVSKGPDVCRTPPSMKPVPYHPVVAHMDGVIRDSPDVRNNGLPDVHLDTRTVDIIGHEPGSGKGVVVPGYKTYSHAKVATDHVYTDGFATVAHRDPAWINHPEPGPTEPRKAMRVASIVVPVCVASGISRSTDPFGNRSYTASYDCPNGATITRSGTGEAPGLILQPN